MINKVFCFFIICLFLFSCTKENTKISIGTGDENGYYYQYGKQLCEKLNATQKVEAKIVTTSGSAGNIRLINQGYLDVALVQSDIVYAATHNIEQFSDAKIKNIHSYRGLYTDTCHLVVHADSDILDVTDLQNKKGGEKIFSPLDCNMNQLLIQVLHRQHVVTAATGTAQQSLYLRFGDNTVSIDETVAKLLVIHLTKLRRYRLRLIFAVRRRDIDRDCRSGYRAADVTDDLYQQQDVVIVVITAR